MGFNSWIKSIHHSGVAPLPEGKKGPFKMGKWFWRHNPELRPAFGIVLGGCALCAGFCVYALGKRDATINKGAGRRWEVVSRERAPLFMVPLLKDAHNEEFDEMVKNRDWAKAPTKRNYPSEAKE